MKKYFLLCLLVLLFSSIAISKENRYLQIISGVDKKIYIDKQDFKYEYNRVESVDYYYVTIKTEFSEKEVQKILDERRVRRLPVNGYDKLFYTIEKRIYRSDQLLCIIEKTDFTKEDKILYNKKYSKKKWIDISENDLEGMLFHGILLYYFDSISY